MHDIDFLNNSFVKITKLSQKNRKMMIKWFLEQNILVQIDVFKEQKNQYFKLQNTQKNLDESFVALCSFYLSIAEFHQISIKSFKKNKDYDLQSTKKQSEFNRKKNKRPRLHKKREFLLDIWAKIQEKKADGLSDRDIAEDMLYEFNFEISHTYICQLWKEIEND
jgi:hypothetical protein